MELIAGAPSVCTEPRDTDGFIKSIGDSSRARIDAGTGIGTVAEAHPDSGVGSTQLGDDELVFRGWVGHGCFMDPIRKDADGAEVAGDDLSAWIGDDVLPDRRQGNAGTADEQHAVVLASSDTSPR